jgi:hypothetical protein
MKLHREKYPGDFIPYNLPELFQGCEKLEKYRGLELASSTIQTGDAIHNATLSFIYKIQCYFAKNASYEWSG